MRSVLLVSFLLGAALPAQDPDFGAPVATTLTKVRAEPEAFKNVKVTFTIQFASLGRISNPFFTKFTPTEYANFYAWADDQPIWQQAEYRDVFGMMFLKKTHPQLEELYKLGLYQRMNVTGVVRNTFQNTPWIEVLDYEAVPGQLDAAVLTHLYRGEKLMSQRMWQRAVAELSRVPGSNVPEQAQIVAFRNLGTCMLRMGDPNQAIPYLQSAKSLSNGRDLETSKLLAMAMDSPEVAIDRAVDVKSLKDSEMPMWEAFQSGKTPASAPAR